MYHFYPLPQENDLIFILFHYFEFIQAEKVSVVFSAPGTGLFFSPLVSPPTLSLAGVVAVDVKEMEGHISMSSVARIFMDLWKDKLHNS